MFAGFCLQAQLPSRTEQVFSSIRTYCDCSASLRSAPGHFTFHNSWLPTKQLYKSKAVRHPMQHLQEAPDA